MCIRDSLLPLQCSNLQSLLLYTLSRGNIVCFIPYAIGMSIPCVCVCVCCLLYTSIQRFVSLKILKKTDAETILGSINKAIEVIGVIWTNVVSVYFDVASMLGQFNGVQTKCKEMNPSICTFIATIIASS